MSKKYTFNTFNIQHGYMGGPVAEVSKKTVWDKLAHDKEFQKMQLWVIKVQEVDNSSTMPGGYYWPGTVVYNEKRFWVKNKTEAKKLGEPVKQIYPNQRKR